VEIAMSARFALSLALGSISAAVVCGVLGCASADPIVVGHHETEQGSSDDDLEPSDQELDPSESLGTPDTAGFVADDDLASCSARPFRACGGALAGTWEMVETCNSEDRSEATLERWSRIVGLPAEPCYRAARLLTSRWSGEVLFSEDRTLDRRELTSRLDLRLTSECLTATLEGPDLIKPTQGACSALNSDYGVTCSSNQGMCQCSTVSTVENNVIGAYDVDGNRLVANNTDQTVSQYDYCVQGDYLLYKQLGDARYAILRRRATALDPVLSLPR
jgi:hypothetical protein